MNGNSYNYRLRFPASPENIVKVEPFIENVRSNISIREDVYGNMLVVLTEAVNNAILHGNQSNHDKFVDVDVQGDGRVVSCTIKDEGPGFDYNNLPDPTAPENLEKLTGRGVFLMKQLSDLVIFSEAGSTVEIQFKL